MPKLPECDRCLFCAHDYHLVCALHPAGVESDSCLDFRPKPELEGKHFRDFLGLRERRDSQLYSNPHDYLNDDEELWQPESACYYNGELILQHKQRWSPEEMLEILDIHPIFTGRCPSCEMPFPQYEHPPVHYDCPYCNWKDDTV